MEKDFTSLPARGRALIGFTPRRDRESAIAIGLHGGASLEMTHSEMSSKARCVNTWLMLKVKQLDPGVRINSRRETRSSALLRFLVIVYI